MVGVVWTVIGILVLCVCFYLYVTRDQSLPNLPTEQELYSQAAVQLGVEADEEK